MNVLWIRRIAFALGGVLLLLAIALAVLLATFDGERFKALAIDWMKKERQRTLVIEGPLELSVFPRIAVKVSKVRLSEHGRSNEFAAVDEASLAVQALPLLRKQWVVDRIRARGVRAVYSRDANGVRNIDDLAGASTPAAAEAGASAPGGANVRFDVGAIELEELQLRVRDAQAPLEADVVLHTFSTGRIASQARTPVSLRAEVSMTKPQALKVALEGSTTVGFDLDTHAATLNDLKLTLNGRRGADQPFELKLDWPRLATRTQHFEASALTGEFKLGGALALTGKFKTGAPAGNLDTLRLPGVSLALQAQMAERRIDGNLMTDLVLQPAKSALAANALELKATVADPGLQPLQLVLRGNGQGDAKSAVWKLEGSLNNNRFDSSGQAVLGGRVPNLQARARFDSLDLNKLLPPARPGAAAAAASGPAPADTPVALDGLNAVDGRFDVSAGAFAFRQYKVSDVKIEAALDGGTLRINRLTGRAWGGAVDASGSAEARSRRIAVKLAADNVNVNALLNDVAGKNLLEGTGHVSGDVSSHGATVGALRANLGGTVALRINDGAIKGINLARSFRQAKALLAGRQDASTKASRTEKTDFSELRASARIAGGVAESDDLDVKSPFLRIGGAGRFDIGRGLVDYTARATVVDTTKGQEGADLAAQKGVTVPVRLSGPFDAIDWKIQWSGVAAAAVENQLREKLKEKLEAPATKDKLRERLKGLLK